jgi:hypothetical protein
VLTLASGAALVVATRSEPSPSLRRW